MEGYRTGARVNPKVVIAESIAEAGIAALSKSCEVVSCVGMSRTELMGCLGNAAGLVIRSATTVDREMIEAGPRLRAIGRAGIGVDNIDLEAATERGILVVNAPMANAISAAEHTMALLLSQARYVPRADATLRSGVWDRKSFQGVELSGKTLGVLGLGKIGTLVAQRCLSFGMRLLAYDPFVTEERARRIGVELVDLETLLGAADFITLHLPRTRETQGLMGKENLAKTKQGVRIVNTSRGGILDEMALAEAVRSGHVAGAAIDVFAAEPTTESPLFELPEVVVTPHLGASTAEAQNRAGTDVADAVAAALRGELVLSAVNVDLGRDLSEEMRSFIPVAEKLGRTLVGVGRGLGDGISIKAEGRIAESDIHPLKLAVLKGALEAVSTDPVSYVNVLSMAESRGLVLESDSSPESVEYLSRLGVSATVGERRISLSGTVGLKGPMLVEILGFEVELPFSEHVLVVRNCDVPGVIGRVGTYLGDLGVNIANMVVGSSERPGEMAVMGLNLDRPLSEDQVEGLIALTGIEEACYVELS